jgi:hypothetical protein
VSKNFDLGASAEEVRARPLAPLLPLWLLAVVSAVQVSRLSALELVAGRRLPGWLLLVDERWRPKRQTSNVRTQ